MAQFAVAPNKVMVNKQFNSPINLYSTTAVNETLAKQTTILSNGAVGIDFHHLAAPNLAKSAVLRMLEEEEVGSRGEHVNCRRNQINRVWPPTPPNSPPSRPKMVHENRAKFHVEWPPKITASTADRTPNPLSTEQTNSSWLQRSCNRQGLKRVAWPPPPDDSTVSVTSQAQNFQNPQENTQFVNGEHVQAYPPAQLLYSPEPTEQTQGRWEAVATTQPATQPVYFSSVVAPGQNEQSFPQEVFQAVAPQTTVFNRPLTQTPPPPSTVTLRPKAPVSQLPPPVIKSQPALQQQVFSTLKMRGDQKWPPADYKAMQQAQETATVIKGPAVKPRLVKKDYSSFFAQHALQPTYAGYRAPPGTQHYTEERPNGGN